MSKHVLETAMAQIINNKTIDRMYSKLDSHQKDYYAAIQKYKVVVVDEPAGTGKTTIAVMAAIQAMRQGKHLVYIRFPSRRGERLGATPGEIEDKEAKYMYPLYEAMRECGVQEESVNTLISEGLISARTDTRERGRNIKNAFVIIDECQNAENIEQLQLVLTRVHDDCKVVMIGHSAQVDSKIQKYTPNKLSAFQLYQVHMTKKNWAKQCYLYNNYRGAISKWADEITITLNELEGC